MTDNLKQPKPAHSIRNACTVEIVNGVSLLCMPDGTRIPNQVDMLIEQPMEELTRVTITVFANLRDTK